MPWNFPYWQVVRALAPALAAGNVVLLKHAPSTTGCGLALADVAVSAGLPKAVLSVLVVSPERTAEVSAKVIEDDRVAAVTLTGSTRAGRSVAAVAGGALKKTVMELGGSDPFVVLADADLDAAAAWAARSRFQNTGQSCIAAKRIVVEESVADTFVGKLLDQVGELKLGPPTAPGVTVGPLAREDLRDAVARQVRQSVAQGARILVGGRIPEGPGLLLRADRPRPCPARHAGGRRGGIRPRRPRIRAADSGEALRLANQGTYGLGSAVWTADLEGGESFAAGMEAGHTAVNGMTVSDPRLPFGGIKDSGFGQELSHHGLLEFVNFHTVVVNDVRRTTGRPAYRQRIVELPGCLPSGGWQLDPVPFSTSGRCRQRSGDRPCVHFTHALGQSLQQLAHHGRSLLHQGEQVLTIQLEDLEIGGGGHRGRARLTVDQRKLTHHIARPQLGDRLAVPGHLCPPGGDDVGQAADRALACHHGSLREVGRDGEGGNLGELTFIARREQRHSFQKLDPASPP